MKRMHDDENEKHHARVGPLKAGADGQDLPRSDVRVQSPLPRGQKRNRFDVQIVFDEGASVRLTNSKDRVFTRDDVFRALRRFLMEFDR